MGIEGHHHRWPSHLSDIIEEDCVPNSESSMYSAGDARRTSKEDETKDYHLSYDSHSIYLDMHRATSRAEEVYYSSPPTPSEVKPYVLSEIEEVHYDYSSSISSNDESFTKKEDYDYDSDGSDASYMSARDKFHQDLYTLMRFHDQESPRFDSEDSVCVAVGEGKSSMAALFWTLTSNLVNPSTTIYLIHVFPETHYVPSPLGPLAKHNVSPDIVSKYETKEREKAEALLKKILYAFRSSFEIQNKVDAVLIQNDSVGKTLLKLIPSLKINTLVLGTGKSKTSSRMGKLKKNGIAHKVYMEAPKTCQVKLVCQGTEVMEPEFVTPVSSPASSGRYDHLGSPLSSASSSWRSNSTSLSWFKRSRSYSDFPIQEVTLEKSKSCTNFQIQEMKSNKAQTFYFHPTRMLGRSASRSSLRG